ncbi:RNA polymerase primary sigma factor [Friedmanniella luteola]|uniref:RNA polymerase primary sigma factor n=1 Tax=Friedmanniella luteola TaxID=546871 RepID=A0A1H1X0R5_9ACTN|nr:sigma-70 family RNA polymerase sigma factor [Friedmanniella luteola]SDT02924.1 RNA polymerase primary sigma factor [Friedmanniella luteola]
MTAARAVLAEPLLTAEEVPVLARAIEAGVLAAEARRQGGFADATDEELRAVEEAGRQAWHRFVRANLRLVALVAGQAAARSRLPEGDLFQEGCLGLMAAVQRYDHTRGTTFATYALFWVRSAVGAGSAGHLGALNLPVSRAEQLRAARGVEAGLTQRLGRTPTPAELAGALGRSTAWTRALLAHASPAPIEDVAAVLAAPPPPEAEAPLPEVRTLLAGLDPLTRQVLELRCGFGEGRPLSLAATGRRLDLSPGQVRRVEQRGLDALRSVCPQAAVWHLSG